MSSSPSENPNPSRRWRFTWETLAHIPTLRLYLFNSEVGDHSILCRGLEASLRLDEFLILVSWRLDDEGSGSNGVSVLRVPVPRVLIDLGCPIDVKAMGDHLEVKLVLLLPVDHPVVTELCRVLGSDEDRRLPVSLGSDIETLSSEGVDFFCRSCSTKLTRRPLRNFVEMPSMNWQEVADNWFGACCCSFGGASEKLVSRYMETLHFTEGTCLLDRTSVTVYKHDLEGDNLGRTPSDLGTELSELKDTSSTCCPFVSSGECSDNEGCRVDPSSVVHSRQDQLSLDGAQDDIDMDYLKINLNHFPREFTGEMTSKGDFHCCITKKICTINHADGRSESKASNAPYSTQQSKKIYGNGFMITPTNISNDVQWDEFTCRHCSSPIGSYPSAQGSTAPVDGGIRLFKCYVSTSLPVSTSDDTFKKYTLENIFTNLLLEGAHDELSFRTIVSDLRTKSPMLQIVLLNSEAWCFSGYCFENAATRGLPGIHMQPVVKVLFSDCSASREATSGTTKEWSTRTHTEEVCMMTHEVEQLRESLKSSITRLPNSYSSLQGMFLSFLER